MNLPLAGLSGLLLNSHVETRARLATLGQEAVTGRRADPARALGGDLSGLAAIERDVALMEGHKVGVERAGVRLSAMTAAMDAVRGAAEGAASGLLVLGSPGGAVPGGALEALGRGGLDQIVVALNTRVGEDHVFAGTRSGVPPLPQTDDILAALDGAVGGIADPAARRDAVRDWFAPGGGLDAMPGTPPPGDPVRLPLAPGEVQPLDVRASDPALRRAMADLAFAALGSDAAPDEAARVARLAGEGLTGASGGLVTLSAGIGETQARAEGALARMAAETHALEMARVGLVSVDPYAAATALREAEAGLETLYAVTARLSRLSLSEYLR